MPRKNFTNQHGYEIAKNFEIGGGVRFIKKNDDVGKKQGVESHFRYQLDASFKHDIREIGVSYLFFNALKI